MGEKEIPPCLKNLQEIRNPIEIQFKGIVPPWFNGTLFSSAPGLFDLDKGSVNHWIDGYAMLSKYQIEGNKLTLQSKFIQSTSYKKAIKAQHPVSPEWGTVPGEDSSRGYFARLMMVFTPFDVTDNCVGRVLKIGPKYYAVGYSCYFHEIDPTTLETLATLDSWNAFGVNSFTPEYIKDRNGDVWAMGSALKPTLRYMTLKMRKEIADSEITEQENFKFHSIIPPRWSFGGCGMRTCFAITENYFIFIEAPWVINLIKFTATFIQGYSMKDWLDWYPDEGTKFCIVEKHTGNIIQTEIYAPKAFIVSSIINAFEENDEIVLDLFTYSNPESVEAMSLSRLRDQYVSQDYESGKFQRFILPLFQNFDMIAEGESLLMNKDTKAQAYLEGSKILVTSEGLRTQESGFDVGVINPNYVGIKHSFIYIISTFPSMLCGQTLSSYGIAKLKVNNLDKRDSGGGVGDDKDKNKLVWEGINGLIPAAPIFIPRPGASEEDDGILITLTVRQFVKENQMDCLVVIDAKTMKEIARAEIPCGVGLWFHANYFPN